MENSIKDQKVEITNDGSHSKRVLLSSFSKKKAFISSFVVILAFVALLVTLFLINSSQTFDTRADDYGVSLYFSPESLTLQNQEEALISLVVDPNGYDVSAVDLVLDYDPSAVEILDLENTGSLPVSLVAPLSTDGKATFIFGATPGDTNTKTAIIATFLVKPIVAGRDTSLNINNTTKVTVKNIFENAIDETGYGSLAISVVPPTPTPTVPVIPTTTPTPTPTLMPTPTPTPQPAVDSIIRNFGFESGTNDWRWYTNATGSFTTTTPGIDSTHAALIRLTSSGSNSQLYQTNVPVKPNTTYKLSFDGRADRSTIIPVYLHKHGTPYTNYGLVYNASFTTNWSDFETTFTTTTAASVDARLRFWFASKVGTFNIDNVYLTEVAVQPTLTLTPTITPTPTGETITVLEAKLEKRFRVLKRLKVKARSSRAPAATLTVEDFGRLEYKDGIYSRTFWTTKTPTDITVTSDSGASVKAPVRIK
ncbi:carbohydrate binding domain-containing protein [Patescibacteria group bacterium]